MARENRWNPTLADLVVLVIGCGVSTAVLRFAMTDNLTLLGVGVAKYLHYSGAAALSLCPLSWTIAGLAMCRTKRRRWASHPAVVVGLTAFALAIYDFVPRHLPALTGVMERGRLDSSGLIYGAVMLGNVGQSLVAWFFITLVAKQLRRPDGWLAVVGWLLWVCWVGVGVARYAADWLS